MYRYVYMCVYTYTQVYMHIYSVFPCFAYEMKNLINNS